MGGHEPAHLVRPDVDVLDQLHDVSEREDEQRVLQLRGRDRANDLEDILLRRTVVVHAKDGVAGRVRYALGHLLRRHPSHLVVVGAQGSAVRLGQLERLEDPFTGHQGLGRRLGHLGRLCLRHFFAGREHAQLVAVAARVRRVRVHLFEFAFSLLLEEQLQEKRMHSEW
jgi:hypothetical protein